MGYLRVHVAPLQQTPAKVPANLTTPEARAQYLETMQQPMQVYPGSQLTVSKIKSVRESQEKAKADAARLGRRQSDSGSQPEGLPERDGGQRQ